MRRSILTSFVVIGAVLALVMGAGTFAVFTDEEEIQGTGEAAIVDFEITGDTIGGNSTGTDEAAGDDILTVVFDGDGYDCGFDFFAPGDTCTIPVQLTRPAATIAQQLAVDLTVSAASFNGVSGTTSPLTSDCAGGAGSHWTLSWAFRDDTGVSETQMPAATDDTDQFIDVTLALALSAPNACQSDDITDISITIHAEQAGASDVHNTSYD
jgi:predicted ribosomally synthesized peptide with SipW-like signal peptide